MFNGSEAPGKAFSSQAKTKNRAKAGHAPSPLGYSNPRSRSESGLNRLFNTSAQPKMMLQGFINAHRLPTRATKKPRPTHQMTHTKVGAKLALGDWSPRMPAAITSRKRKTADTCAATMKARLWSSAASGRRPKRL